MVREDAARARRGDPGDGHRPALPPVLISQRNNFVERPWGGVGIRPYKRLHPLPDQIAIGGAGLGEAFEIAAWDDDPEARAHPTWVRPYPDRCLRLSELLDQQAEVLLGADFIARYGRAYPLLPKTLDIRELLSVQGHPAGHTEAYVVIDAEPGATIRLGFTKDMDAGQLRALLGSGQRAQKQLLDCFEPALDQSLLHATLGPWLATREKPARALQDPLSQGFGLRGRWADTAAWLDALKHIYWQVLDAMNAIPVVPGQVIHNETPARVRAATGRPAAAEVHALGNPEGREILMLEIRRPGPTLRAWDNVRFPLRTIDVDAALQALNLAGTAPEEFIVERPPGVESWRSIDGDFFTVEHLSPVPGRDLGVMGGWPHSLHVIRGRIALEVEQPLRARFVLARGDSALISADVAAYAIVSLDAPAEVVKAALPQVR
jgi:mannose-6-phosphate isomerase class I